jgi:hypothetical protein
MPDIELRIDAINNLPKLIKNYTDTSTLSKGIKTAAGVVLGGQF